MMSKSVIEKMTAELANFPETPQTDDVKKKLEDYEKLDNILGEPEFGNELDRIIYRRSLKYFDATGFSDIILDTVGYLYENPCPLTEAGKIYETVFTSNGEFTGLDTSIIKNEIQACEIRIETLKEEIKDWFLVLIKLLRKRKVHNPYGICEPLVFHSNHLLDAFSIYSRPEDYPEETVSSEEDEDPEEAGLHPYLLEPGETFLNKSVEVEWFPWENDIDKRRECLKYVDIKSGIPPELDVYFDWIRMPRLGLNVTDEIPPAMLSKITQTPPLPVNLTIQVLKGENLVTDLQSDDDNENDGEIADDNKSETKSTNKRETKKGYFSKKTFHKKLKENPFKLSNSRYSSSSESKSSQTTLWGSSFITDKKGFYHKSSSSNSGILFSSDVSSTAN